MKGVNASALEAGTLNVTSSSVFPEDVHFSASSLHTETLWSRLVPSERNANIVKAVVQIAGLVASFLHFLENVQRAIESVSSIFH